MDSGLPAGGSGRTHSEDIREETDLTTMSLAACVFCQGTKQRRDPKGAQDSQVQSPALDGVKRNSISPEKLVHGVGGGLFSAEATLGS